MTAQDRPSVRAMSLNGLKELRAIESVHADRWNYPWHFFWKVSEKWSDGRAWATHVVTRPPSNTPVKRDLDWTRSKLSMVRQIT